MQQKIIYLVDDDEDDRFFLTDAIQAVFENVSFREFKNGLEFLTHVSTHGLEEQQCLVLMDMNMPLMSGIETIKELRSGQLFSEVPVVVISTSSSEELIRESHSVGASAYLVKPDSTTGLLQTAKSLEGYFSRA
ncbi:response regulator [Dyadobacter sp. Leaf189]|uniref:response regulator n=1 Tax=Dyadobacter sp. Leaf189 TaxID=1736295 RepID=UPI0006FD2488|nr:response regulator [Dyadobacter sp. Leaf189]KQS30910.1 hypothetical protein ASG33_11120 [Dyadobacter sp. Leaf189]